VNPRLRDEFPAWPVLLVGRGAPARGDDSPEADWAMALILLARTEGHCRCGGLRPGPVPERPECTCGGLRFQVFRPVPLTAAELAAVVLPREARRM